VTGRALILTEGSAPWGLGHLHRCAAYAEELAARGWSVEWRVQGDALAETFLRGRAAALDDWYAEPLRPAAIEGAGFALIDSYHASPAIYRAVAERVPKCLYLDDEARLPYPRGWIANGVPGAEALPYVLGPGTRLLAGPRYHAMRAAFRARSRCL